MNKLHTALLALCLAATGTTAVAMEEMGHGAMEMKKSDKSMEQGAMRMEHKEDKMMKQDKMEKKKLTEKEKKAMKKKAQEKKMKKESKMKDEKMEHGSMQRMK